MKLETQISYQLEILEVPKQVLVSLGGPKYGW